MTMPITDKPPTTNASLVSVDSPELSLPARRDGSVSSLTISGAGGAVLGVVVLTVDSVVVGAVVEGVERGGLVVDRGADVVLGARVVDGAAVVVVSTELVVLLSVVGVEAFNEYFDGDSGRGLGASFQGWTLLVTRCLEHLAEGREEPPLTTNISRRR